MDQSEIREPFEKNTVYWFSSALGGTREDGGMAIDPDLDHHVGP